MILEKLRTHTASIHQELEQEVRIEESTGSVAGYRRLLERFYGFHKPMEERLGAVFSLSGEDYCPDERLKSPWLQEDLHQLGLSYTDIEDLPLCSRLPDLNSLARGYGSAYVLEGSTLGGRHIARLLNQSAESVLFPKRFFQSYQSEVGLRWKEFCASLDEYSSQHPHEVQGVIRAAEETFSCFRNWIR